MTASFSDSALSSPPIWLTKIRRTFCVCAVYASQTPFALTGNGDLYMAVHHLLARRRRLLYVCSLVMLLLLQINAIARVPRRRSCHRLIRNEGWWHKVWTTCSDVRFKKTSRVSRATFHFILSRVGSVLQRQTVTEEPISPEERLGICLYRLGRGDYYYTIAEMVGRGVATVSFIVLEVCQVLVEYLWTESISSNMPKSREDFEGTILDMEELWQFPCCWVALDGCHIPIKCPPGGLEACKEYHNFKIFYSIVLMAMIDSHYRFVWGSCGYPGNSHDAIISGLQIFGIQSKMAFYPTWAKLLVK